MRPPWVVLGRPYPSAALLGRLAVVTVHNLTLAEKPYGSRSQRTRAPLAGTVFWPTPPPASSAAQIGTGPGWLVEIARYGPQKHFAAVGELPRPL